MKQLNDLRVDENQEMKLVVELENPCEVSWLKDNRPLDPKRDGVKIETGKGNRYLLTLPKASVTDSGIYSLRAQSKTNKKQFSTTNCNVVVRGIYISCMQKNLLNCELDFQSPKTKQKKNFELWRIGSDGDQQLYDCEIKSHVRCNL